MPGWGPTLPYNHLQRSVQGTPHALWHRELWTLIHFLGRRERPEQDGGGFHHGSATPVVCEVWMIPTMHRWSREAHYTQSFV